MSAKQLVLILLFITLIGCGNKNNPNTYDWNFDSVQLNKELYLFQTDDRFGEWGGNTYLVRLYRSHQENKLKIDYKEYEGQVGPPEPPDPNSSLKLNWFSGQSILNEVLGIDASNEELNLISNAIQELIKTKVNNDELVSMSGVVNRIMYSDSSMIVEDYPSTNWEQFQKLKHQLLNE